MPEEAEALHFVISKSRETARLYGYKEVVTPLVETYELLSAKSGEEIRSHMFTFKDLGDRNVALRPEFTASIARLATSTLKKEPKPLRVFSVGSVYRYDEPQRGRYREFWQSNFEVMGSSKPEADAEAIILTNCLMKLTGIKDYSFKIGHIGVIRGILSQYNVEEDVQNSILRLMDKKEFNKALELLDKKRCREVLEGLLELKASTAFETAEKLQKYVKDYKVAKIAAKNLIDIIKLVAAIRCPIEAVEPAFARGLDYYTGAIFEVKVPELDIALGGGGRYDKLVESFGGDPTPAVGVAHGIDRIILATKIQESIPQEKQRKTVMIISVKPELKTEALRISEVLREAGIMVGFEIMGRKMTKALEDADRRKVDFVVIVGSKELRKGAVAVRDLANREQFTVKIAELPEIIKGQSKNGD
jgi:histidyl-tRNA synthetase